VLTGERRPLREALQAKRSDIHQSRLPVHDQFCHACADGWRDLESSSTETAVQVETIRSGLAQDGALIWGDAVIATVRAVQRAVLDPGDAPAKAFYRPVDETGLGVSAVVRRFA
jgi:hypothetical protein